MRFARVAALAAMPSLVLFSTTAFAASSCWYPNEAKAAQLRDFHTMLMVGTLQCRGSNISAVDRYNDFVTKQRGILDANAHVLKAHFVRESGITQGQLAYDQYATALANGQSAKGVDPNFCSTIDTFVRVGASASQQDLLVLAQSMSEPPASGACPPSNYAATAPATGAAQEKTADATAPAPEPAVATAAAEAAKPATDAVKPATDAPAPTVAAASAQADAEKTAVTAQTTSAPAAAPAAPAAAPVSREDALQAAVAALQSAAAALQAASTAAPPAPQATPVAKPVETAAVVKVEDAPVVPPKEATTP